MYLVFKETRKLPETDVKGEKRFFKELGKNSLVKGVCLGERILNRLKADVDVYDKLQSNARKKNSPQRSNSADMSFFVKANGLVHEELLESRRLIDSLLEEVGKRIDGTFANIDKAANVLPSLTLKDVIHMLTSTTGIVYLSKHQLPTNETYALLEAVTAYQQTRACCENP